MPRNLVFLTAYVHRPAGAPEAGIEAAPGTARETGALFGVFACELRGADSARRFGAADG